MLPSHEHMASLEHVLDREFRLQVGLHDPLVRSHIQLGFVRHVLALVIDPQALEHDPPTHSQSDAAAHVALFFLFEHVFSQLPVYWFHWQFVSSAHWLASSWRALQFCPHLP